jgi:hypothetical protein
MVVPVVVMALQQDTEVTEAPDKVDSVLLPGPEYNPANVNINYIQ